VRAAVTILRGVVEVLERRERRRFVTVLRRRTEAQN
jgi:hypothetical protein